MDRIILVVVVAALAFALYRWLWRDMGDEPEDRETWPEPDEHDPGTYDRDPPAGGGRHPK
jgi:hypothetical protein